MAPSFPTHFIEKNETNIRLFDTLFDTLEVEKILVFFFSPRSGSTFLSDCMNKSQILGDCREYLNKDIAHNINQTDKKIKILDYAKNIKKHIKKSDVFSVQIDIARGVDFLSIGDFIDFLNNKKVKYFFIERDDILNQTYSLCAAKSSGIWHKYYDKKIIKTNPTYLKPLIDNKQLIKELREYCVQRFIMKAWKSEMNSNYLEINYKQISNSMIETILKICDYSEIKYIKNDISKIDIKNSFVKNSYLDKNKIMKDLNDKYYDFLKSLEEKDFCVTRASFDEIFKSIY